MLVIPKNVIKFDEAHVYHCYGFCVYNQLNLHLAASFVPIITCTFDYMDTQHKHDQVGYLGILGISLLTEFFGQIISH